MDELSMVKEDLLELSDMVVQLSETVATQSSMIATLMDLSTVPVTKEEVIRSMAPKADVPETPQVMKESHDVFLDRLYRLGPGEELRIENTVFRVLVPFTFIPFNKHNAVSNYGLLEISNPEIKGGIDFVGLRAYWPAIAQRYSFIDEIFEEHVAEGDQWQEAYNSGWYDVPFTKRRAGDNSITGLRVGDQYNGTQIYSLKCKDVMLNGLGK